MSQLEPARTVAELHELQALTGDPAGAQRVAWTPVWLQAREWLAGKLDALGVQHDIDEAGNQWATLPGRSTRALLIGGHLDSVPGGGWLDGIGEEDRQRFRERGRRMVECLLAHLDADTPGPALANLREACDHAVDYGAQTAALGASLSEAIDAFVRFRQPFVEQLADTARGRGLDTREAIELLTDAESANDGLLLAFVDGWQRGEMPR